ncbi:hypothetical protein [Bdellovibrio sp. HCB288]|uniref:hypothetical protein n=1 Tax=Bdellovibrio sp. HCB288 TaxID=3394355 RepID=UPI0039B45599
MELALAAFMQGIGFTFSEVLKMLVLVGLNFVFMGVLIWRLRGPIIKFYNTIMTAMEAIPEMQKSISDLNQTMQQQNYQQIKQDIQDIKTHLGMK